MALDKPYSDIPGTVVFDAEQSRKGYWLNQFCMSLMKAEDPRPLRTDCRGICTRRYSLKAGTRFYRPHLAGETP